MRDEQVASEIKRGNEVAGVLKGCELYGVLFVLDYVQLLFERNDERILTLYETFSIDERGTGASLMFPGPGSRDAICSMIGSCLADFEFDPTSFIEFRMTNGGQIRVEFDDESNDDAFAVVLDANTPDRIHFAW